MEFEKNESRQVNNKPNSGRKSNQRAKLYLVLQILQKRSDEYNPIAADDIAADLDAFGIDAERRSIYKDIEDLNKVYVMMKENCTIDEAEKIIAEADDNKKLMIKRAKKGFYINPEAREFQLNDIRLITECVYSTKFIPSDSAERLANILLENVSEYQARKIKTDAVVVDRVKTLNKTVLTNIDLIRDAMATEQNRKKHIPEKISFKYARYEITNVEKPVVRSKQYTVSPYYLIISDGNYYLLAYDDGKRDVRTYRVDRMKNIKLTGQPRGGLDAIKALDVKNYTQRVFSMYGGEKTSVSLRFDNSLLDTVLDRFGTKTALYSRIDDEHFQVNCDVEVSPQFFGWLCGFGSNVEIVAPKQVREEYQIHLKTILNNY